MDNKMKEKDHRIIGYVALQAEMETLSPLRLGSGRSDRAEVEVIRLPDGSPYVSASGLVGALYHRFQDEIEAKDLKKAAEILWGTEMTDPRIQNAKQTWQSHLSVPDMFFHDAPSVKVRDGVRINHQTNTADDGAKFDYELLEPGQKFTFRAEITLREGFAHLVPEILQIAGFLKATLHDEFSIGGLTTRGFGRLNCNAFHAWHFDFEKDGQAKSWFDFLGKDQETLTASNLESEGEALQRKARDRFSVRAKFGLKSSLIIGTAGGPDDEVDKVQLRSNGKPVISGTSLAGAIRHRAWKILRTMGMDDPTVTQRIGDLFGDVDLLGANGEKQRAKKSRVVTHESEITFGTGSQAEKRKKQTRIRINRFTGGVIRGGLFESEPIWRQGGQGVELRIDIRKGAQPWEMALLLQILKDLWTSDLAIGGEKNVGRGLLVGRSAQINLNGKFLSLEAGQDRRIKLEGDQDAKAALEEAQKEFLEQFKIAQTA